MQNSATPSPLGEGPVSIRQALSRQQYRHQRRSAANSRGTETDAAGRTEAVGGGTLQEEEIRAAAEWLRALREEWTAGKVKLEQLDPGLRAALEAVDNEARQMAARPPQGSENETATSGFYARLEQLRSASPEEARLLLNALDPEVLELRLRALVQTAIRARAEQPGAEAAGIPPPPDEILKYYQRSTGG